MSAKIIRLEDYRRSGITCAPIGITFPNIMRHTGLCFVDQPNEVAEPHLGYVLGEGAGLIVDQPTWSTIERLDPTIDSGWLFLRHHRNLDRALGYVDAYCDLVRDLSLEPILWQTPAGIFTLARRDAIPGRPDHLLVYTATIPHPTFDEQTWTKVIASDGSEIDESIVVETQYS